MVTWLYWWWSNDKKMSPVDRNERERDSGKGNRVWGPAKRSGHLSSVRRSRRGPPSMGRRRPGGHQLMSLHPWCDPSGSPFLSFFFFPAFRILLKVIIMTDPYHGFFFFFLESLPEKGYCLFNTWVSKVKSIVTSFSFWFKIYGKGDNKITRFLRTSFVFLEGYYPIR